MLSITVTGMIQSALFLLAGVGLLVCWVGSNIERDPKRVSTLRFLAFPFFIESGGFSTRGRTFYRWFNVFFCLTLFLCVAPSLIAQFRPLP